MIGKGEHDGEAAEEILLFQYKNIAITPLVWINITVG
jgi:hypothetical protein